MTASSVGTENKRTANMNLCSQREGVLVTEQKLCEYGIGVAMLAGGEGANGRDLKVPQSLRFCIYCRIVRNRSVLQLLIKLV